jgi:hypothetical protein
MANPTEKKVFKYYDLIMAVFVTVFSAQTSSDLVRYGM